MLDRVSDSSDKLSQQLEILNRFNPHTTPIFPTLARPFLSILHSLLPYSQRSFWVLNGSSLRIILTGCMLNFSSYNFLYVSWLISTKSLDSTFFKMFLKITSDLYISFKYGHKHSKDKFERINL